MGLIEDVPLRNTVILVDTNVMIEAVRTSTWNAITGNLHIETVEECRDEACRGDQTDPAYVLVTSAELGRLRCVHSVSATERAELLLTDPQSHGLDPGERDLFAHAFARKKAGDSVWLLSSPDKASIRAAFRGNVHDSLVSLQKVCKVVGARPTTPFKKHHLDDFLSEYRTDCVMGLNR